MPVQFVSYTKGVSSTLLKAQFQARHAGRVTSCSSMGDRSMTCGKSINSVLCVCTGLDGLLDIYSHNVHKTWLPSDSHPPHPFSDEFNRLQIALDGLLLP